MPTDSLEAKIASLEAVISRQFETIEKLQSQLADKELLFEDLQRRSTETYLEKRQLEREVRLANDRVAKLKRFLETTAEETERMINLVRN